jgi:RNA polymerase sigma-B factor
MDLASRLHDAERAGAAFSDAELVTLVRSLPPGDARREEACEAIVARYQGLLRSTVQHYRSSPEIADELMQVGYLGLMKAINGFDPQVGTSLQAYARPCISGEIKRYFRDRRWSVRVCRPAQELRLELRDASAVLTQRLARDPRPAELAEYLNVSEERVAEAQLAGQAFQAMSLDAPLAGEDGTACLGDMLGEDDPQLEHAVDLDSVLAHWGELDTQCQQLLTLRFYGNLTQEEIGTRLGVSQMQVSRLLRRTLDYLRGCLLLPPPDIATASPDV